MKEKLGVLVCAWLLVCGSCLRGKFVVKRNSLRVTSPKSIKGEYESALGDFGIPQHRGALVGNVVYPISNQKACRSFDEVDISFKSRTGGLPTIVLVDRGDCYFALKAWNVQASGAAAVLIVDDMIEPLISISSPDHWNYLRNITIPSALITKSLGNIIKKTLSSGEMVNVNLDWAADALLPSDEPIKYEFWTSGIYECGLNCDAQIEFVKSFKRVAQTLEQKGYTQFTPHYITWYCPEAFVWSKQCRSQCVYRGKYCIPDPQQEFSRGYEGKDILVQNLRQACFFKVVNESGKPWLWWDYVIEFAIRCPMKDRKYNRGCGDQVIQSLGVDLKRIDKCIGDPQVDMENPVLKAEQDAQNGKGTDRYVTTVPTLVINNRQYRGNLDKEAVLKAICAGFQANTKPAICSETRIKLNATGGSVSIM